MKLNCVLLVLFALNLSFSQTSDKVLLTVDGDPIKTSEFLRVYNKNLDLVKDESQKDIDGYLKLFTEYQLKLKEAKRLGLNEDASYQREFLNYKRQLTKNYLNENKVTDALVEEAYQRGKQDIKASHILVRLDDTEQDTLGVYNKVLALKERVEEEGFDKVKAEVHDGKNIFLEDLGYFSAFKMVYDFESAAYKTPVGEISEPFRTQFGYHVVKVDDKRPSRGTITAAHIMVASNQKDSLLDPGQRINEIYKKLNQGESFESLAKQFSDDKSSAARGGELSPFKSGQLSSVKFEDEAFALKNDGDVSKPFQTEYGYHIVKRLDLKPVPPFEDMKSSLESRVKRDARSKLINTAMVKELKNRYKISHNNGSKIYFTSLIDVDFYKRTWKLPEDLNKEKVLFSINDEDYTYYDFGRHLMAAQRAYINKQTPAKNIINKEYDVFFEKSILQYREDHLELENEDFANILKEYRDGLLLFELMENEVWNKASKDSVGLKKYYENHKADYQWNERVDVVMVSSASKNNIEAAQQLLQNGKSEEDINTAINTDEVQNVIFTKGVYSINDDKLPVDFKIEKGLSNIYYHNDAYHIIEIIKVLPAATKTLEEARGNVINDYQAEIEANWIADLYDRFDVEVNKKALKKVKEQIEK